MQRKVLFLILSPHGIRGQDVVISFYSYQKTGLCKLTPWGESGKLDFSSHVSTFYAISSKAFFLHLTPLPPHPPHCLKVL